MTRINWGSTDARLFEFGVDRGVFYPEDGRGVPWNGLTAVNEAPSGSDVVENYLDGQKFATRRRMESFAATIEAYNYPVEFEPYDGQISFRRSQRRRQFGFSYRTLVGNAELGSSFSYKIHLVYNALATPSAVNYHSLNDSSDTSPFSWSISTIPIKMGDSSSAHLIIDPRYAYPWVIEELEKMLYGSNENEPYLPPPGEILDLFEDASILKITDHGDGTWTAEGPDSAIQMLSETMFEITWPSAVYIDDVTYRISSL